MGDNPDLQPAGRYDFDLCSAQERYRERQCVLHHVLQRRNGRRAYGPHGPHGPRVL